MKKKFIIKKSEEFTEGIKKGKYYKSNYFTVYIKKNNLDYYRFGISIGKKVGKAVIRNKIKRQMRMIIDNYKKNYQNGVDYIIIIKSNYIFGSFDEIKKVFEKVIDNINKKNINERIKNENE